jgi:hypothetical protein
MSEMASDIKWDPQRQMLAGWLNMRGARVHVSIPRDLIHSIPIYNDITEQEIGQFKYDIIERLKCLLPAQSPG